MAGAVALSLFGYYAYVRLYHGNFHVVVPGQVYRSAQPSPEQLRQWKEKYGLRAILNLRGDNDTEEYEAEERLAEQEDLELINIRLSATHAPSVERVRELIVALETAPRPLLLHCRDGADRSGVASILAAMAIGGEDYESASRQLSVRYLHVDPYRNRIVVLVQKYEAWCRRQGLDTDGWDQFRRFALNDYVPEYYRLKIEPPDGLQIPAGGTLTVKVRITNDSDEDVPLADPDRRFNLAVFQGSSRQDSPDRELGPRTPLPKVTLKPGRSIEVAQKVEAPSQPGRYEVHLDVVEEGRTFFARQGSPMGRCDLTVTAPR